MAAVREVAPLRFVNGGGTGSVERTAAEAAVTEVAAGSGLYGPTLFDAYGSFTPQPAALFALPVVRRPDARTATLLGGGYPASGAAGPDRLPAPHRRRPQARRPGGRRRGPDPAARPGAADLRVGDRVWMRHAKAGELCERFNELHLVRGDAIVETVPTYRGEGQAFSGSRRTAASRAGSDAYACQEVSTAAASNPTPTQPPLTFASAAGRRGAGGAGPPCATSPSSPPPPRTRPPRTT